MSDTDRPGARVTADRVIRRADRGAIALLHDGDTYDARGNRMETARALPRTVLMARQPRASSRSVLAPLTREAMAPAAMRRACR